MTIYWRVLGIAISTLYFLHCAATPTDFHFIDFVNLIFHEAGHVIFMFFGDFLHVAMGSGFQVLLPLLIAIYFFFTHQVLSAAICFMWAGESLINVSIYAGDAVMMQLPLLGGDSVMHDWNYLLSDLNILSWAPVVARALYDSGVLLIAAGAMLAGYVLWTQWAQRRSPDPAYPAQALPK